MPEYPEEVNFERIELLSSALSRLFKSNRGGPCACSGLSCVELGCPHWWNEFLRLPLNVLMRILLAYEEAIGIRLTCRDALCDLARYQPLFTSLANRYLEESQSIWFSGCEPQSDAWWRLFLERTKPADFSRMIHMYLALREN